MSFANTSTMSQYALSSIVMCAILVLSHWRMFAKAGEKGWKALIPLYSDYTLFKLVWTTKSFWIYMGTAAACGIFTALSGQIVFDASGQIYAVAPSNFLFGMIAYVASIVFVIYTVLLAIRTALAYGKKMLFGLGILILPIIFKAILAFGSATYHKPR